LLEKRFAVKGECSPKTLRLNTALAETGLKLFSCDETVRKSRIPTVGKVRND